MHDRPTRRSVPVSVRAIAFAALASLAASVPTAARAFVPSGVEVSLTGDSLLVDSAGRQIALTVLCPGFRFVPFGTGGPHFSPDLHWILIDVTGPYLPGDVATTHALVHTVDGALVRSPDFPAAFGAPNSLERVAWASGELATLRYADGKTYAIRDPRARLPQRSCAPATPR